VLHHRVAGAEILQMLANRASACRESEQRCEGRRSNPSYVR
jgi:hypothetical protein